MTQEIYQVIQLYQQIFPKNQEYIFKDTEHFKVKIKKYSCKYAQEIKALAKVAKVNALSIYGLYSRSQILCYYAIVFRTLTRNAFDLPSRTIIISLTQLYWDLWLSYYS